MEGKHTATPWAYKKDGRPELRNQNNLIEGANGELIVYGQIGDADASFVVRACNSHDHLVAALENNDLHCREALKLAHIELKAAYGGNRTTQQAEVMCVIEQALAILDESSAERAALSKAGA